MEIVKIIIPQHLDLRIQLFYYMGKHYAWRDIDAGKYMNCFYGISKWYVLCW
jgi:hypothetical protein